MTTTYRRLTYRDYDSSAILTALEQSIAISWQLMHEYRKASKGNDHMARLYGQMAVVREAVLRELLRIRREARES